MVQTTSLHGTQCVRVGVWQCSPTVLKGRVVCGTVLWGNALKRSPGIIRKSRVSYPGPGFISSATRPLLPIKHYNGLNQTILTSYWQRRVSCMRQGMLTLSGAPSTTSLIGYYHLSVFGLLHLVHIS